MDRIKRLSYEVLDKHQSKFGEDFADNKKVLDQISIIRSKGLKNEVAGYITKFIKKQIREEKAKQAQRTTIQTETISETPETESAELSQEESLENIDEIRIIESSETTEQEPTESETAPEPAQEQSQVAETQATEPSETQQQPETSEKTE